MAPSANSKVTTIKYILFFISLLDYMGFTITATVFPSLLLSTHNLLLPPDLMYSTRLFLVGILLGLYPFGQFFSATVLGGLSDKYGRKKILLISLLGTACSTAICAIAINIKIVALLFIARLLTGLFAGNIAVAQASIIDISDAKSKAANISLLQLSLGLAWVLGAPLGSFLSNMQEIAWSGFSTPFWVLSLSLFVITLIVFLYYQETLSDFRKDTKIHAFKGVQHVYMALTNKSRQGVFLTWIVFIGGWAFFLQFLPTFLLINFHYTTIQTGPLLAFMGGTFAATQLTIARPILKRMPAEKILAYAMIIPGLAAIMMALSSTWLQFHLAAFLFPFSMGFTLPSLLAVISNRGISNEQGLLLGMASSLQALVTIIVTMTGGELLAFNKYSSSIGAGCVMLIGWLLFICLVSRAPQKIPVN